MKKYILGFAQSNKNSVASYLNIKNGSKTVETRAVTTKYKNIQAGDILVFVCGKDKFERKIKKATKFRTISAMLKKYKTKDIMPELTTKQELEQAYYGYTGYKEKIKKFGLVALEL